MTIIRFQNLPTEEQQRVQNKITLYEFEGEFNLQPGESLGELDQNGILQIQNKEYIKSHKENIKDPQNSSLDFIDQIKTKISFNDDIDFYKDIE